MIFLHPAQLRNTSSYNTIFASDIPITFFSLHWFLILIHITVLHSPITWSLPPIYPLLSSHHSFFIATHVSVRFTHPPTSSTSCILTPSPPCLTHPSFRHTPLLYLHIFIPLWPSYLSAEHITYHCHLPLACHTFALSHLCIIFNLWPQYSTVCPYLCFSDIPAHYSHPPLASITLNTLSFIPALHFSSLLYTLYFQLASCRLLFKFLNLALLHLDTQTTVIHTLYLLLIDFSKYYTFQC